MTSHQLSNSLHCAKKPLSYVYHLSDHDLISCILSYF